MKKNIAIIGASYLQLPLIEKAKEMGFVTHVFAWAANDVGEEAADFFYPVSIIEKDVILEKCREIGICGICSIASDLAMVTVNYVADALHLVGNSLESTQKCTNKHSMRLAFEENGDPSPRSYQVDSQTDLNSLIFDYPVIVKPTDRSGSRGIYKLYNSIKLVDAVKKAIDESFEKKALIEEFAEGNEYSVEYISYKGHHTFLQLTQKYTTGEPYFVETRHVEPAMVSEMTLLNIKAVVEHALNTLKVTNGASHSEIKIDNSGRIKIIEIGARMGGDCIGSDLVRYSTGYDYVKMVIEIATGDKPDFSKVCEETPVESVFIINENDYQLFNKLIKETPEDILKVVDIHPERIGHVTDSSNRGGCYIKKHSIC